MTPGRSSGPTTEGPRMTNQPPQAAPIGAPTLIALGDHVARFKAGEAFESAWWSAHPEGLAFTVSRGQGQQNVRVFRSSEAAAAALAEWFYDDNADAVAMAAFARLLAAMGLSPLARGNFAHVDVEASEDLRGRPDPSMAVLRAVAGVERAPAPAEPPTAPPVTEPEALALRATLANVVPYGEPLGRALQRVATDYARARDVLAAGGFAPVARPNLAESALTDAVADAVKAAQGRAAKAPATEPAPPPAPPVAPNASGYTDTTAPWCELCEGYHFADQFCPAEGADDAHEGDEGDEAPEPQAVDPYPDPGAYPVAVRLLVRYANGLRAEGVAHARSMFDAAQRALWGAGDALRTELESVARDATRARFAVIKVEQPHEPSPAIDPVAWSGRQPLSPMVKQALADGNGTNA